MMTSYTNYQRNLAGTAQQHLAAIDQRPTGIDQVDSASRRVSLCALAKSIVKADRAMCHRGMVTRASQAL